jgi:hypothetical protein
MKKMNKPGILNEVVILKKHIFNKSEEFCNAIFQKNLSPFKAAEFPSGFWVFHPDLFYNRIKIKGKKNSPARIHLTGDKKRELI